MTRWLHYLLTLTLLLNAVALPWTQAQCAHRQTMLTQEMPCHSQDQSQGGGEAVELDGVCACGCLVQAALSLSVMLPTLTRPVKPDVSLAATFSAPPPPLLLRPPIA